MIRITGSMDRKDYTRNTVTFRPPLSHMQSLAVETAVPRLANARMRHGSTYEITSRLGMNETQLHAIMQAAAEVLQAEGVTTTVQLED